MRRDTSSPRLLCSRRRGRHLPTVRKEAQIADDNIPLSALGNLIDIWRGFEEHVRNDLKHSSVTIRARRENANAHAKGHLRNKVVREAQSLSFRSLSISVMGETTHIPCPLHKPAFRNGNLQTSHRTTVRTRRSLSRRRQVTVRAPIVFRIKITAAAI
jgi:hypothetical protein